MASPLDSILDIVKRKVSERISNGNRPAGNIFGQITDILGQRAQPKKTAQHNVRPASEDPYGDPADEKGAKKVRPASEDPYGDPADEKR
jgi:hypothetical protein